MELRRLVLALALALTPTRRAEARRVAPLERRTAGRVAESLRVSLRLRANPDSPNPSPKPKQAEWRRRAWRGAAAGRGNRAEYEAKVLLARESLTLALTP